MDKIWFYNNFEIAKEIFKEAGEKLNYKISKIILEGPEEKLKLTQNTQPAILTVSYAIFSVLKEEYNFDNKLYPPKIHCPNNFKKCPCLNYE